MSESEKIGWPVVESILYGMTKALDYLGEQGQILVDKMGEEMLNYLLERGHVERSEDPQVLIERVGKFFVEHGLAGKIEAHIEGDPPKYFVAEYRNWSYYDVFRTLRDKECFLYSCPSCLIEASIFKKAYGLRLRFAVKVEERGGKSMIVKHQVVPAAETFGEEAAKEISEKIG